MDMVICPSSIPDASMAFIMPDDSMKASIPRGSVAFVELNTIPAHRELGLFKYHDSILVRRAIYRKYKVILKADNLLTKDIIIEDGSQLTVIGKIHVEN